MLNELQELLFYATIQKLIWRRLNILIPKVQKKKKTRAFPLTTYAETY